MTIGATMAMTSDMPHRHRQDQAWLSAAGASRPPDAASGAHPPDPRQPASLARAALEARIALEEAVDAATLAVQRAQSVSQALEEALVVLAGSDETPRATVPRDTAGPALSPREREVLALVAEGRSNKAIAEALFVSPNTIKTHIASLLNKLRAETRVQLAVIAARQATL